MDSREDPRRALILILLASASFAGMAASVKALPASVTTIETIFFRGLVGLVGGAAIHAVFAIPFRPRAKGVILARAVTGGIALLFYYGSIHEAGCELATANLLLKTSPLWVVLLSSPILGERPGGRAKLALAVGLAGAALAFAPAQPRERVGIALGLGSGVFSALAYVSVRRLASTDEPTTVVTAFTASLAIATAPLVAARLLREGLPPPRALALLGAVGAFGTIAQLFMTNAFRHAGAAAVSISGLAEVGFTLALSAAIFREWPTWNAMLGGTLAVAAGIAATWPRGKAERAAGAAAAPADEPLA